MTYSKLATKRIATPNYNPRNQKISKITIHHMAGVMTAEACANLFKNASRQASANYCIGNDGSIVACADETTQRAWTSGSEWNDQRAVTIEVSNDKIGGSWSISKKAWNSMIALCADICDRNKIIPKYDGTKNATLTEHRMFQATACPGEYIHKYLSNGTIEKEIKAKMKTITEAGWKKNSKGWWYDNGDGTYPKSEWKKIKGEWYYFDGKGYMVTGWITWKSNIYYCLSNGKMATGKLTGLEAEFDSKGKLKTK